MAQPKNRALEILLDILKGAGKGAANAASNLPEVQEETSKLADTTLTDLLKKHKWRIAGALVGFFALLGLVINFATKKRK